ncbi:tyrosine-type recombinase/integrase [Falsihalocynthiibacter sp. CO-5D18]|uniref:tyrosine-type recombinase/integrase n=1 Tax=Falsihalocynthiibacter sp. CO-5D18 TaxID=3240872 RepID=UPI00350EEA24
MLTDAKARKIQASGKPLAVGGATGLYLRPGKSNGAGKFTMRFVSPETQKRRDMGLGSYPAVSILSARKSAFEARELIAQGIDPIEECKRNRGTDVDDGRTPSFEEACQRAYADIAPSFKNKKHRDQWINTLLTYACPEIGHMPVDELKTADFARVLKPIWLSKPETASRVRQRCERVMTWCLAHEFAPTNPVSAVSALLPKQKSKRDRVEHFPSVAWRDLPNVANQLFAGDGLSVGKQALMFVILTGTRSGEVRGLTWDEIDFDTRVWTLSAQRMKKGKQHRVPLSTQALEVLEARQGFSHEGPWVFSSRGTVPVSDMTMTKVLRDNKIESDSPGRIATVHGFRSSLRDWASEHQYSKDLAERALSHAVKSATEAAYHRTDLLEQRRPMMQAWADYCFGSQHLGYAFKMPPKDQPKKTTMSNKKNTNHPQRLRMAAITAQTRTIKLMKRI